MKKILTVVSFAVMATLALNAAPVHSAQGRFSANMPGVPRVSQQQFPTYQTTSYEVNGPGDRYFVISYTDYSPHLPGWNASDWASRMVGNIPGAQMVSSSAAPVSGHAGGYVVFQASGRTGLFWAAMIENRLYQIGAVGFDSFDLRSQASEMLRSFHVTSQAESAARQAGDNAKLVFGQLKVAPFVKLGTSLLQH